MLGCRGGKKRMGRGGGVGTVWGECGGCGKAWEVWESVLRCEGRCRKVCWGVGGGDGRGGRCGDRMG